MSKNKENFLDYIPKHNALYNWEENKDKHVVVHVLNRGMYNRIAQVIFKKPKISKIELDDLGSFVWKHMDGKKTVFDIGNEVKNHFGKDAEPVYERLSQYIATLHKNQFIVYVNKMK